MKPILFWLQLNLGDYDKAIEFYEHSLSIYKTILGTKHYEVKLAKKRIKKTKLLKFLNRFKNILGT